MLEDSVLLRTQAASDFTYAKPQSHAMQYDRIFYSI